MNSSDPIQYKLSDDLFIPFGCPKWGIEKIKIVGRQRTVGLLPFTIGELDVTSYYTGVGSE